MAKNRKHHNPHARGHKGHKEKEWLIEADDKFQGGLWMVQSHPLFVPIMGEAHVYRLRNDANQCPIGAWAIVTNNGDIHVDPMRLAEPEEWAYILAHCLLHLGFDHFREQGDLLRWNVACDRVVARFLQEFKFGTPPEDMRIPLDAGTRDEDKLYQQLLQANLTEPLQIYSTYAPWQKDMVFDVPRTYWHGRTKPDWAALFGHGLANAVMSAVQTVSGHRVAANKQSESEQCKTWFLNHFPLLGALAVTFKVIEDTELCRRMDISVAAVNAEAGEIYMNPSSFAQQYDVELRKQEYRFVMAHELLHVALRHHARRQGRDPFLWNVACDYVINGWLMDMQVGTPPQLGLLYDPQLKDLNAEAIYDKIVNDLRMYRKKPSLQSKLERAYTTFGGKGVGDMLEGPRPDWWAHGEGTGLDDFYRRALAQGFQYHVQMGRGLIPAGLIEEIMAIGRPPIPWDVELAQWFDAHFPPLESRRTFARPSRRQSSTPDIPRPNLYKEPIDEKSRTFGVVLDTSGSMSRTLLAKALGAIANYALEREVPFVRVVFCDAHPYDQGYMLPEDIAGRVKVKGRGGTILMPGVELLENAEDFPKEGPILIITDTECDRVTVKGTRDAAFLVPHGRRLPFPTHSPVFYVE